MVAIKDDISVEIQMVEEIDSAEEWRLSKKLNESAFKVTSGSEQAKCIHQSRSITC